MSEERIPNEITTADPEREELPILLLREAVPRAPTWDVAEH